MKQLQKGLGWIIYWNRYAIIHLYHDGICSTVKQAKFQCVITFQFKRKQICKLMSFQWCESTVFLYSQGEVREQVDGHLLSHLGRASPRCHTGHAEARLYSDGISPFPPMLLCHLAFSPKLHNVLWKTTFKRSHGVLQVNKSYKIKKINSFKWG